MELENTNAAMQPGSPDLALSEPHFEDEATLLSARPVVPLDEPATLDEVGPGPKVERSSLRFPGGWILAATVVGAMLLGALGSALYLSLTNREGRESILESEALATGVVGEVSEPARNNQATPAAASDQQNTPEDDQEIVNSGPSREAQRDESENEGRKPVARRVAVLSDPSTHEERKEARRLAREQRREFERENRRNRDLTHIREIFEGTQRP